MSESRLAYEKIQLLLGNDTRASQLQPLSTSLTNANANSNTNANDIGKKEIHVNFENISQIVIEVRQNVTIQQVIDLTIEKIQDSDIDFDNIPENIIAYAFDKRIHSLVNVQDLGPYPEIYLERDRNISNNERRITFSPAPKTPVTANYMSRMLKGRESEKHLYVSPYQSRQHLINSSSSPEIDGDDSNNGNNINKFHDSVEYGSTILNQSRNIEEGFNVVLPSLCIQETQIPGTGTCPKIAPDNYHQAETARLLAQASHNDFLSLLQEEEEKDDNDNEGNISSEKDAALAERNLWYLLDKCCRAELLCDIDIQSCDNAQRELLDSLPISTSLAELETKLTQKDLRLRKGAVLLEWLQDVVKENIIELPNNGTIPFEATINATERRNDNSFFSIQPDAHNNLKDKKFTLQQQDDEQQISTMCTIWSLVRAGQLDTAQEIAHAHGWYWLAVSLSGAAEGSYIESEISNVHHWLGNSRRPLWQRTAWGYANELDKAMNKVNNKSDYPNATAYESMIYASLSDNLGILLSSQLMNENWNDRLWAVVKATHSYNMNAAIALHRERRLRHSKLYTDSNSVLFTAIQEQNQRAESIGLCKDSIFSSMGSGLLQLSGKPSSSENDESALLHLQAAIISGRTSLNEWIKANIGQTTSSSRLLRVHCHLCIWIRLASKSTNNNNNNDNNNNNESLSTIESLSDQNYYSTIEMYCEYLIRNRQQQLVAPYAVFLSTQRRIRVYVQLLRSISPTQTANEGSMNAANEALELAKMYFDPSEVMQIASNAARYEKDDDKFYNIENENDSNNMSVRQNKSLSDLNPIKNSPWQMRNSDTQEEKIHSIVEQGIQRLQWLLLDQSHCLEAVQQACNVAILIIIYSTELNTKSRLLSCLLRERIPIECEQWGWALLRLENERVESANATDEERKAFALRKARWCACLLQLQFWNNYVIACESSAVVQHTASHAQQVSQIETGIDVLQNNAEIAASELLRGVSKTESPPGSFYGAAAVWYEVEVSSIRGAQLALLLPPPKDSNSADYTSIPDVSEMQKLLDEIKSYIDNLYPENIEPIVVSNTVTVNSKQMQLHADLRLELNTLLQPLSQQLSDIIYQNGNHNRRYLRDSLSSLHSSLTDVSSIRKAGTDSLLDMINMYLEVCTETANIAQEKSLWWHSQICYLSNTLADTTSNQQLYELLPTAELERILSKIAQSAGTVVNGRGSFILDA
jgi:hypothetical protein